MVPGTQRKHRTARNVSIVAAALLLGFAGLASAAELVIWHAYRGQEKAAFEKAVGMFNEAHSGAGISAKTLAVPFDAYADKITAAVPRGRGPDVFIFAQDRLGGWVEGGQTVEPIDFFIEDECNCFPFRYSEEHHADLQQGAHRRSAGDHRRTRRDGQETDRRIGR